MQDELIDSLDSVVWYNCHYYKLNEIKQELLKKQDSGNYKYDYGNDEQFQVIWMILVCLFGDYGSSPRSGWLEMNYKDKIINFIDNITTTARNEDEI